MKDDPTSQEAVDRILKHVRTHMPKLRTEWDLPQLSEEELHGIYKFIVAGIKPGMTTGEILEHIRTKHAQLRALIQ